MNRQPTSQALPLTTLLLAALALWVGCWIGSCTPARPITQPAPLANENVYAKPGFVYAKPDSVHTLPKRADSVYTKPGLFRRLFPATAQKAPTYVPGQNQPVPRKCKGCTFYYATATVTTIGKRATAAVGPDATATAIAKKAGPSIVKSDSATQQVATNAVAGRGNTATQTATTQQAPGIGATIAGKLTGPLGWVLGLAAVGLLGYGIYYFWWLIPRRKTGATPHTYPDNGLPS